MEITKEYIKTHQIDNFLGKLEELLNQRHEVYFDEEMCVKLFSLLRSRIAMQREECNFLIYMASQPGAFYSLKSTSVCDFLVTEMKVDQNKFIYKNKFSMDMKEVLIPLSKSRSIDKWTKHFLEQYIALKKMESALSGFESKYQRSEFPPEGGVIMRYRTEIQETGRVYYSNEPIVSVPKFFLPAMRAPKDKYLLWGDFAQIDFRLAYNLLLRTKENEKYFKEYEIDENGNVTVSDKWSEDYYKSFARSVLKNKFNQEEFLGQRNGYKTNSLAAVYGSGIPTMNISYPDSELNTAIKNEITTNEKYNNYKQRFKKMIEGSDLITIYDYFGFERTLDTRIYGIENKCLNTPIQATSASLVTHLILIMKEVIPELDVYLIRHDEPIFMIDKNKLTDEVKNKIQYFQNIVLDDSLPFRLDFSYGEYYLDNNNGKNTIPKSDKYLHITTDNWSIYDYSPVRDTAEMEFSHVEYKDLHYALVLHEVEKLDRDKEFRLFLVGGTITKHQLRKEFNKFLVNYCTKNHIGLVKSTSSMFGEDVKEETLGAINVKYCKSFCHGLSMISKATNFLDGNIDESLDWMSVEDCTREINETVSLEKTNISSVNIDSIPMDIDRDILGSVSTEINKSKLFS